LPITHGVLPIEAHTKIVATLLTGISKLLAISTKAERFMVLLSKANSAGVGGILCL
jgi:hypothetical protein